MSYANVASTLALFFAISGGTALAAATISSSDIQTHAVTGSKIAKNAVTKSKIKTDSVGPSEIQENSISSAQIKSGSLLASDFASGQLPAGPQGPPGPAGSGAGINGVVSPGGALVYGKGVAAVSVGGAGVYTVTFNQNVSQCPAVASIGGYQLGGSTAAAPNGGTVTLQPGGNTNQTAAQQITFITRDLQTNANTPLPFHFGVFC
ncbi:MAG TPA: hypothetical protein VFG74_09045 [Miltoncostaeaceae bacterium]|nr:hypothetical protein [Miltoncostaeaceae bacterium]